jgi:hypothetical protein
VIAIYEGFKIFISFSYVFAEAKDGNVVVEDDITETKQG